MNRQVFLNLDFFNDRLVKNSKVFPFKYGLNNLGNTCFMNSILNCLFGDLELCQLVVNPRHFDAYSSREDRLQFIKHFSNLVRAAANNKPEVTQIAIGNFEKMVRSDAREMNLFPRGQQADAHEFLVYLIRRLKEQFDLVLPTLYPHQDRFETIFGDCQVGLGQVTYCEKNHRSQMLVREMLSLDIENNSNIQECLSEYFRPVNIMKCICSSNGYVHNGKNPNCNAYKCDQCNLYVGATKTLSINHLPSRLILHLKRFRFDQSSSQVILISL
jgi:ubiquitin C-terminal hydrolase